MENIAYFYIALLPQQQQKMNDQSCQYCSNCEKSLPESKFDLHLGYCRRNIRRCPDCSTPYDINEEDEHHQQFHSFQNCQHCGIKLLLKHYNAHINDCPSKPIPCSYCELPIPMNRFDEHRVQCEARTRSCERCSRPVSNREYFEHIGACEGIPPPEVTNTTPTHSSYSSYANSFSSSSSYQPQIRTYTRVTTTDPRTGITTTTIEDEREHPRVIRRPYVPNQEGVIRHEARELSSQSSNLPTNTSTYSTSYTSPRSVVPSSYSQSQPQSQYVSESDDPELQAALLASLGYDSSLYSPQKKQDK